MDFIKNFAANIQYVLEIIGDKAYHNICYIDDCHQFFPHYYEWRISLHVYILYLNFLLLFQFECKIGCIRRIRQLCSKQNVVVFVVRTLLPTNNRRKAFNSLRQQYTLSIPVQRFLKEWKYFTLSFFPNQFNSFGIGSHQNISHHKTKTFERPVSNRKLAR